MKKIVFLVLLLGLTQSAISWARYDPFATPAEQETQLKIEEMQRQLQQAEIDRQIENEARDDAAREAAEQAQQEAEERAREATEQAEQAAEELRNEMLRSSIRIKNNIYLGVALLAISGFVIYLISRRNKEKQMDENQKYGIATIIVSFLLILLVLMISEGWNPQMDYLENLLNSLHIELIQIENENYRLGEFLSSPYYHLIYWPSKYVVLVLLSLGAYGLTTYLGITGAFRPWRSILTK